MWRGTSVCAYCRSTAQAAAPRDPGVDFIRYAQYSALNRPREYYRLTTD